MLASAVSSDDELNGYLSIYCLVPLVFTKLFFVITLFADYRIRLPSTALVKPNLSQVPGPKLAQRAIIHILYSYQH